MKTTKEELIKFLEEKIFIPAETNEKADNSIKKKIQTTRMRINKLKNPESIEMYFWSALATDNGIDSYKSLKAINAATFEDIRLEFKKLCGR